MKTKRYIEPTRMSEDELYDYKEVIGESLAQNMTLAAKLKKENKEEREKLVKVYQWGE